MTTQNESIISELASVARRHQKIEHVNILGMDIEVKTYLLKEEANNFVQSAVNRTCEMINAAHGVERDFNIKVLALHAYTNIFLHDDIPLDDWINDIVYSTPLYALMTGTEENPAYFEGEKYTSAIIDMAQYHDLISSIKDTVNVAFASSWATARKEFDEEATETT